MGLDAARRHLPPWLGRVRLLSERQLVTWVARRPERLDQGQVAALAAGLADAFPPYDTNGASPPVAPDPPPPSAVTVLGAQRHSVDERDVPDQQEELALLDARELEQAMPAPRRLPRGGPPGPDPLHLLRPHAAGRAAVWEVYLDYQARLRAEGLRDLNEVLALAVQLVNLLGVHLLHALVGDRPDGLLLIGDGQQAVYPGGFTLAEAGISVTGRSTVLRTNYRNGAAILDHAAGVVATEDFADLDGVAEQGRRDVRTARPGGVVVRVEQPDGALHDLALVTAQGIEVVDLEDYDGRTSGAVKVGTVHCAKGLEFAHAYLPRVDSRPVDRLRGESEAAYRERVELAHRQLFMGMTRARDLLWLGYCASP